MEHQTDELLTPKELAARLKVCERTIYNEQRDGKLPGRIVRGKLRFYWPDVVRAIPAAPVKAACPTHGRQGQSVDLVAILKRRAKEWKNS